jgi:hypothetical protein
MMGNGGSLPVDSFQGVRPTWPDQSGPGGSVSGSTADAEVQRAMLVNGWSSSINTQFIVVPQQGSTIALTKKSFCAEHFYTGRIFSIIPYTGDSGVHGLPIYCESQWGGSSIPLSMTSLASHEYAESATDPDGSTGWRTIIGRVIWEIGDLCENRSPNPNYGSFGLVYAQFLWSNAASGCGGPGGPGGSPTITSVSPPRLR